jgi:hypothetical protein
MSQCDRPLPHDDPRYYLPQPAISPSVSPPPRARLKDEARPMRRPSGKGAPLRIVSAPSVVSRRESLGLNASPPPQLAPP